MNQNTVKYEDEMKKSYIDYAMSVIMQRALPDVRDGLKPVHRRILYTMKELNNYHDKPHKKSARIVGDVLGKYHPHGDASVYDAMVRLAQDFNMQAPLIDGHGNFGSIDGDGAAAMRYTEARLMPITQEMLKDLDAGVGEMVANFDNTLLEPKLLPTRLPNLLLNGSSGIAVGMATSIPSHNLNEVLDAAVALIDQPDLTTKQIMRFIKGPDFPTGGIIANKSDLHDIYDGGKGKIRVRAKIGLDKEYARSLVITEIPYTLAGNKTRILEEIIKLMSEKKLDEVSDVRDESSKEGLRIIIEMKKGTNPDVLIQKLYESIRLEDTFSVNLLAVKDKKPMSYNLKGLLTEYVYHVKAVHRSRLVIEISKYKDRREIVDGLIKATNVIDLIIQIIRGGDSLKSVKNCLVRGDTSSIIFKTKKSEKEASKLHFTDAQATAILAMQLQRLIGLELERLERERKELDTQISIIEAILATEETFNHYVKTDIHRIRNTYGTKRKTRIENLKIMDALNPPPSTQNYFVLLNNSGYIRMVDSVSFNRMNKLEEDNVFEVTTDDTLKIFTKDGTLHQIKIEELPLCKSKDRGTPLERLVGDKSSTIVSAVVRADRVVFVTAAGYVKQVSMDEFTSSYKSIKGTKLEDGDSLVCCQGIAKDDNLEVLIRTLSGREIRFDLSEVPVQRRTARGVVGIKLPPGDNVSYATIANSTGNKKSRRGGKGTPIRGRRGKQ